MSEETQRQLVASLKTFFEMLETGQLVRDISQDAQPGWAARMGKFALFLATTGVLIARAEIELGEKTP